MSAGDFFSTVGGQYNRRLSMREFALGCGVAFEGHDSSRVATSYNNIAGIYQQQSKYQEALKMHMRSLEIKIRVCGGDSHTSVADSYNHTLALPTSDKASKYQEALEMHTKSLEIRIRVFGGDSHPVSIPPHRMWRVVSRSPWFHSDFKRGRHQM
jgi:tetratricopeptide (TPR) repeat protein